MRTTPLASTNRMASEEGIDDASQQRVPPAQSECVGKCPQRLLVERAQRARQEDRLPHQHLRRELIESRAHEYASTRLLVC